MLSAKNSKSQEHITAEVIAKSLNTKTNDILTTFKLTYPRIIHDHVMAHRIFSRNSSSSRAVPVKTQLKRLENKKFIPEDWVKNCRGMAPQEKVTEDLISLANLAWQNAFDRMCQASSILADLGVHKELANRLTEPFQIMEVLVTATNFDNFHILRSDSTAQSQVQKLAITMRNASLAIPAVALKPGEFHLPFLLKEDLNLELLDQMLVSTARCCRVSYFLKDSHEVNQQKDLELAKRLISDHHMSPTEHIAMAFPQKVKIGNFVGWMQFRKFIPKETYDGDAKVPVLNSWQANYIVEQKLNPIYHAITKEKVTANI